MHKLLLRQLKGLPPVEGLPGDWQKFIAKVDEAYRHGDADRALNERSMELASAELVDANEQLRNVIEDLKKAEEVKRALSLLQSTLNSTADGIIVSDAQGCIVLHNNQFLSMWGFPGDLQGAGHESRLRAHVLALVRNPEDHDERVRHVTSQPELESIDTIELVDGRTFERFSIPHRVDGKPVGRVWCYRDVTNRKRLEEKFRQSQKMEAVGRLAGGVAHDFNNLLTVITGYVEMLLEGRGEGGVGYREMSEIRKAADRATGLTRQLLAFSRKKTEQNTVVDVNQVVRDVDRMLRRLIVADIELETELSQAPRLVRLDPGQLEQVLVNLVVNARDAMPSGGRIVIRTSAAGNLTVGDLREPRPCVLLSVTDTGCGMDSATQSHLFEPFFTTKAQGKGTGLGLSTVYGIVTQAGGQIMVISAPGNGTTMQVFLPLAAEAVAMPAPEEAALPPGGAETILLAEDEDAVRGMIRTILERSGYQVITACNGEEALSVMERHPGAIDLLLTDVVMPVLNGIELVKRLPPRHSATKVLFMSGYSEHPSLSGATGTGFDYFQKPFTPDALARKVRERLDAGRA